MSVEPPVHAASDGVAPETRADRAAAFGVFTLTLALYVSRLCPTLAVIGDSPEIVTAAAGLGVPHAPGYPLSVLLGHIFSWLPIGNIAWRVNLMSAVLHSACAVCVFLTARTLTGSVIAALSSTVLLVLARSFFMASLYAEVFPLNDCLFSLALLLAIRIWQIAGLRGNPRQPGWRITSLFLVLGFAGANQQMIVLALPALAAFAGPTLVRRVRSRWPRALVYFALAAIPFSVLYALVPVLAAREPAVSWGDVHGLRSLLDLIFRSDYGGPFQASRHGHTGDYLLRLVQFTRFVRMNVGVIGIALAALGLLTAWQTAKRASIGLGLAFALPGPLLAVANSHFAPAWEGMLGLAERFVSMCLIPLCLLAGCAIGKLESLCGIRAWSRPLRYALWLLPALSSVDNVRTLGFQDNRRGIALAHDLVTSVPDNALVLLGGDAFIQTADYVCGVENDCANRVMLAPGMLFLPWYRTQFARRTGHGDWISGVTTVKQTHQIIERVIRERPVYVLPYILHKDPVILKQYVARPDLLYFRIYTDREAELADRPRLSKQIDDILAGTRCEGCAMRRSDLPEPSFELATVLAYSAALSNTATWASTVLSDPERGQKLELRARMMARSLSAGTWPRVPARERVR